MSHLPPDVPPGQPHPDQPPAGPSGGPPPGGHPAGPYGGQPPGGHSAGPYGGQPPGGHSAGPYGGPPPGGHSAGPYGGPPPGGYPAGPPVPQPQGEDPGRTLGIISIVAAFVASVVGIVVGAIGRKKSREAGFPGTLGTIGMSLSIVTAVVGLVVGVLVVTADGRNPNDPTVSAAADAADDADRDQPDPDEAEPTATAGSDDAEPDEAQAAPPNGEATQPGTALTFGDTALLPRDPTGGGGANLSVTVTDVVVGSTADFELFDEDTQASLASMLPYYVKLSVVLDAADEVSWFSSVDFELLDQDGDDIQDLMVWGRYAPCDDTADLVPGTPVEVCLPFIGPSIQEPTTVQWVGDWDSAYDHAPVTWTR